MTPDERTEFLNWLQTHTALGRISLFELETAFERAETQAGYTVSKSEPARASNV